MKTQSLHSSFTVNPAMYCYRSRRASACYRPRSASTALCILTHQVMPFPMLNRTDTVDMDWHDLSVTQIQTKVTQIKYNFFFNPVYSRDCLKLTCKNPLYLGLLFCLFLGFLLLVLAAGGVIISAGKSWAAGGLTAALYFFLILLSVCLLRNDKQFKTNSVQNNCQKHFNDYLVGNWQGKIQKHLSDDGHLCAQSGSVLVSA